MPVRIEVLMMPGCDRGERTLRLVEAVAAALAPGAAVTPMLVTSEDQAARLGFPGSPTVRVDGRDVEPDPPPGVGLG